MDTLFLSGITRKHNVLPEKDRYLLSIPALRDLKELDFSSPVTFFVGENGSGKSTLLEAIAVLCGFNPEGGTRNMNFSTLETHSELHKLLRPIRSAFRPSDGFFLRAESFYNVSSEIEALDEESTRFGLPLLSDSYGGKSLHRQSHGESFLSLVVHRFGGNGLYLLDEPEAALSPSRQLSLLSLLHDLVKDGSQFLIATHSPILMAYPGADILLLGEEGIARSAYEDTEHYLLTKTFLDNPHRMLRHLFKEED